MTEVTLEPTVKAAPIVPDKMDSSKRVWRNNVSEELDLAGMPEMAERWLTCSDRIKTKIKPVVGANLPRGTKMIAVCAADHHHDAIVYSQSCDLRICPDCAAMHSARLVARFMPKCLELAAKKDNSMEFRHLIFTTPYELTDPDARQRYLRGFKQVEKTMNAVMARWSRWKLKQGWINSAEFGERHHKLHFHVIHYGKYLPHDALVDAWRAATNDEASIVYVIGMTKRHTDIEKSIREVLKYATKFYSKDKVTGKISYLQPDLMPVLAKVLEKTRRVRAYGIFYNLPDPERAAHSCDTCESPMIGIPVTYFETYCNTGMLPYEFERARRAVLLHLKPADKSPPLIGALAPPDTKASSLKQKELAILKDLRIQAYD